MDENRIEQMFQRFGLDAAKREEFARFAQQGPLSLEPEQPADFRLDCMTLSEEPADNLFTEETLAKLA
jgi:hypothetical protein